MAEVLTTMVVGPLVSMVKEKAYSKLLDQYQVMEGLEEKHNLLKRKLPAILDVIADAEEQAAAKREGAAAWLEEVRKVAYQANDVLDEFKYEALRRKAKAEGHYKALGMDVIKLFPTHNRVVFRYRMGNKICMILRDLDTLIMEMNVFRFKFKPEPPMSMKWRQTDAHIPMDCVNLANESRRQEKMDLVNILLSQASSEDLLVLPIVGMGGMGKTTLAQLVYNDTEIKKHFQLQLWVCVSNGFDVASLAGRIVEANGRQATGNSVLEKLQDAVSGKRYLLVLDDVWNLDEHKWAKLKSYLGRGGRGSSVLATTRDQKVAKLMMGTNATGEPYSLKSIDESFVKKIIETRAFSSLRERPAKKLLKLIGEIAKRCSGSPLAATALGSLLSTKTTEEEWKVVLSKSSICDEETGILPILKLSYNGLPSYMRQCFAFCAMFPKDYEIDVEMLIQLWMANGFIPQKQRERPEIIGKNIFIELASRSFFQDVKGIPFQFNHTKVSRITCKIHDLMHDVAMDSVGNECATIATELNKSGDFPYSARHLFLSVDQAETILNASLKKESPSFQTLIFEGKKLGRGFQKLSKYRSVRALKIQQGSFLRPKYLHHLRYLDLSESDIEELPEDISILYHLQTLNLSYCSKLERLPKELKYLTALRHLYTHGCERLKSMPAGLGRLTSLQTLTYFVADDGFGCSDVGELQNLDLGGKVDLRKLEKVAGDDGAQAAGLGNKEKLTELELRWTGSDQEAPNNNHKEVLEGLKPHDGLKVLRIYYCGSSTFPRWINALKGMVELKLFGCKKLEKLPPLWQLAALQILHLEGLWGLLCLCSRGSTPVKFPELKELSLRDMPNFEAWCHTDEEVQGEEPIFPKVEKLVIDHCMKLTALPPAAASVITESSGGVETVCRCSAFPELRKLKLSGLSTLKSWGAAEEGAPGDEVTFPLLEDLKIDGCPTMTDLPKAPKLSVLVIKGRGQQISLQAASRYIPSLSSLTLDVSPEGTLVLIKEQWDHKLPLAASMWLIRCNQFFSNAMELWPRQFALVNLTISECDALVYWPKNVFQFLVYLTKLSIISCRNLIGCAQASDEQSPPSPEQGGLLPFLEFLEIQDCTSLVQVPNLPVSLKALRIDSCGKIESILFGQEEDVRSVSGEGVVRPDKSSSIPGSSSSEATASTAVLKLSSTTNHCFLPCLESLVIQRCNGLSEVANLPPSIKTLDIEGCRNLQSLSGQLDVVQRLTIGSCSQLESLESCFGELQSLEELKIFGCESLVSLPDGPQAYSSLRVLQIEDCDGIMSLPQSLQSRLGYLEKKHLDVCFTEPKTDTVSKAGARLFPRSLGRKVTLGWCARNSRGSTR